MIYIPKWVLTLMERGRIKCSRQGNVGGRATSERGPTWLAASKGEWTVEMWVIRIPAGIGRHEWSVTWHRNQYGASDLVLVLNSQHTLTWPTLQHTAASTHWLKTLHLNVSLTVPSQFYFAKNPVPYEKSIPILIESFTFFQVSLTQSASSSSLNPIYHFFCQMHHHEYIHPSSASVFSSGLWPLTISPLSTLLSPTSFTVVSTFSLDSAGVCCSVTKADWNNPHTHRHVRAHTQVQSGINAALKAQDWSRNRWVDSTLSQTLVKVRVGILRRVPMFWYSKDWQWEKTFVVIIAHPSGLVHVIGLYGQ